MHMRDINNPIVFWQSWRFLCAVLKTDVPGVMFGFVTWNTPVEKIVLNNIKYPFPLVWWLEQQLPASCVVYSEEVRENGIILETGEYFPQEYSPPFESWGTQKADFRVTLGKPVLEKKLKYIFFQLVHLDEVLLYLCRTTPNTRKKLWQHLGTRRSLKEKAERENVSEIDTIRFS